MLSALRAQSSSIGTITTSGSSIGRYQKLELTFDVTTSAANKNIPYEPTAPAYASNLKANENAQQGISVDGLLLPPGQTNWSTALVQPGFLYRNYTRTLPSSFGHPIENLIQSVADVWKIRFAPTQIGTWQYRIRVTDASGTVTSAAQTVNCVASTNKGFLRVSPTDSRYFQFDNGDPANLVGYNVFPSSNPGPYDDYKNSIDQISATGASTLLRLWISSRSGIEVVGGFANSDGGRYWFLGPGTQIIGSSAHSGRFSMLVPAAGELTTKEVPLKPSTAYTVSAWVNPQSTGQSVTVLTQDSNTYLNTYSTSINLPGNGWTLIQVTIPAHNPQAGNNYFSTIKLLPQGGSNLLVDDVKVVDAATGVDTLEVGDFERHVTYNQRQSWLLDSMVDYAAQRGQYLRLNCLENDDSVFCNVAENGTNATHDANNFFGTSSDPNADLAVRRWQRYYARYLVARWGYATSVAQWEFNNEGPLFNGNHYAAAQSFAQAVHSFQAEGRRPCSTSFWQNSAGTSYPADFFNNPAFPDIDYADVHYYPSTGIANASYNAYGPAYGGFAIFPTGGPSGLGRLDLNGITTGGQDQKTPLAVSRIKGSGTWTISYQLRADNTAQLNWFGRGPDLDLFADSIGTHLITIPNNPGTPTLPPGFDWRTYSATFNVSDDLQHDISLYAYSVGLTGGSVDYSNIKIIAPDGRLWAWYPYNEPLMDHDTASLAAYLGLTYTSYSGDPSIGKPLSIGETDIVGTNGSYNDQILQDNNGVFMRQFCWGHLNTSGAMVLLYDHAGNVATQRNFWQYAAAYQKFMQGIPLTNGRYRNAEATADTQNLVIFGQKDSQAGQAHLYVYNRNANWYNLTFNPSSVTPVSGNVTVPGIPNGTYVVQAWDTTQGQVNSTISLTALNGTLIIPINNLGTDTALKITLNGTGLKGQYFNDTSNTSHLTTLGLTKTDPQINLSSDGINPPATGIQAQPFSVRWSGQVRPRYSESYTFNTTSDDGVRMWVDKQLLINNWTNHGPTVDSGIVSLQAGQLYDIQLEYFNGGGGGIAKLEWQSPSQAKEVVPQSQLYPTNVTLSQPPVAGNASTFISQSVPPTMVIGQAYSVLVTLQNTGSNTWTSANNYHLGSQNPQDNNTWGMGRVNVPASVPFQEQATFSFTVTAPTVPGTYNFQWKMVQDGVEWFGVPTTNVPVTVTSQ